MPTLDQCRIRTEFKTSRSQLVLAFGPQTRLLDQPGCLEKIRGNQSDVREKTIIEGCNSFLR